MNKTIKAILFIISILTLFNTYTQTPIIDKIFEWDETTFKYQSTPLLIVDTTNKKPITGWVRFHREDRYFLRHYSNGKLHGYSVFYVKKKQELRLQEISKYDNGKIE